MPDARCTVCRRSLRQASLTYTTDTYIITFKPGVCDLCVLTLSRAFEGVTELLRESHGERRERVIDRLAHKLEEHGFTVGQAFTRRRSA